MENREEGQEQEKLGTSSEVAEVQVRHYGTSDGGTGSGDRETPMDTIYEVNNNRIQAWIV